MGNLSIKSIVIRKLVANPNNPNIMNVAGFVKLVRNIGQGGIYEPLLIRRCKLKKGYYEIINGYHRCRALLKLGYKNVDCVLCDVSDDRKNILTATLNRLHGKDNIDRRKDLFKSLIKEATAKELAMLLPVTAAQIQKFIDFDIAKAAKTKKGAKSFAEPMVFFLNTKQKETIDKAIELLADRVKGEKTKAAKSSAALTILAEYYIKHIRK